MVLGDFWCGTVDPSLASAAKRLGLVLKSCKVGPVTLEHVTGVFSGPAPWMKHSCEILIGVRRDNPTDIRLVAMRHDDKIEFGHIMLLVYVDLGLNDGSDQGAQNLANLLNILEVYTLNEKYDAMSDPDVSHVIEQAGFSSYPFCAKNGLLYLARIKSGWGPFSPSSRMDLSHLDVDLVVRRIFFRGERTVWGSVPTETERTGLRGLPIGLAPGSLIPDRIASMTAIDFGSFTPCKTAVIGFYADGTPALLGLQFQYYVEPTDVAPPTVLVFDAALESREAAATLAWQALEPERFAGHRPPFFCPDGNGRVLACEHGVGGEPIGPEDGMFRMTQGENGWSTAPDVLDTAEQAVAPAGAASGGGPGTCG